MLVWYTMVYGGIRVTCVCGIRLVNDWYTVGIRWYTGHMRVWYTSSIRLVYDWYTVVYGSHLGVVYTVYYTYQIGKFIIQNSCDRVISKGMPLS
jgi:hypothetical protein